ncbi:MAG TPA: zinc ribbon domain-containing protein [Ktedonobacteraceae bacterium]|nr:zinc ribbon domain-containing protein [Ktedonobacteraceae bacterium]
MAQNYVVPNIYHDMSDQSQGYFAFRFTCQRCYWQIDTRPIRSQVSTATNIMDIGAGLIGGFWGRAVETGQKIYGSRWHTEQADALQKSWAEIQHNFHTCPKCQTTVCMRCFNVKLNLCVGCAPDLRADGAQFQHQLTIDAQREQIQQGYHAPHFDLQAVPSAVTPDMVTPAAQPPQLPAPQQLTPAAIAGHGTSGYPSSVVCPTCRRAGAPGKFCQDCGTKLPMPDLFCPQCASPVEGSSRFCQECGAKLQNAT